jgi:RHS repeat-associated protein
LIPSIPPYERLRANSGGTITTYTYDYRNSLTEVEQGGTVIATYTYNALNQRIGIDDSGGGQTWTVYNGTSADALPYADFNGSGTLLTRYVSGPGIVNGAVVDELLARTSSGGTTAWYLTDKLDSVRDIVSSSGTELDHIVYDSFGNILTETNVSNGDRFKFAGMVYDSTTGQYYDRARGYNPAIGRFTSSDPLVFKAGDGDLYRYVRNSPTDDVDSTGAADADLCGGLNLLSVCTNTGIPTLPQQGAGTSTSGQDPVIPNPDPPNLGQDPPTPNTDPPTIILDPPGAGQNGGGSTTKMQGPTLPQDPFVGPVVPRPPGMQVLPGGVISGPAPRLSGGLPGAFVPVYPKIVGIVGGVPIIVWTELPPILATPNWPYWRKKRSFMPAPEPVPIDNLPGIDLPPIPGMLPPVEKPKAAGSYNPRGSV